MSENAPSKLGVLVKHLQKAFRNPDGSVTEALEDVTLDVPAGGFVSVVGPSGCGKTTLLRLIAGLLPPTSGEVWVDHRRVEGPGRDRGMVFQAFTLFPWLTVYQNVAFGCRYLSVDPQGTRERVHGLLEMVGLTDAAKLYPHALSGGMQQRAAIARTLMAEPDVLLMDEPFGSLDTQTRDLMQELLLDVWSRTGKTVLFVTHDVEEAVFLSDAVAVLSARPARVTHVQAVGLPRPRTFETKSVGAFTQLRASVAQRVRAEARVTMA